MMPNMELRYYAKGNGVALWQIAKQYKVSDQTLIRRMRVEFTENERNEFIAIVDDIKKEGK